MILTRFSLSFSPTTPFRRGLHHYNDHQQCPNGWPHLSYYQCYQHSDSWSCLSCSQSKLLLKRVVHTDYNCNNKALFVSTSDHFFPSFSLPSSSPIFTLSPSHAYTRFLSTFLSLPPSAPISSSYQAHPTSTTWTEYQVAFVASTKATFSTLRGVTPASNSLYVTTFLTSLNYPCYYDSAHPRGYAGSGRWVSESTL